MAANMATWPPRFATLLALGWCLATLGAGSLARVVVRLRERSERKAAAWVAGVRNDSSLASVTRHGNQRRKFSQDSGKERFTILR